MEKKKPFLFFIHFFPLLYYTTFNTIQIDKHMPIGADIKASLLKSDGTCRLVRNCLSLYVSFFVNQNFNQKSLCRLLAQWFSTNIAACVWNMHCNFVFKSCWFSLSLSVTRRGCETASFQAEVCNGIVGDVTQHYYWSNLSVAKISLRAREV